MGTAIQNEGSYCEQEDIIPAYNSCWCNVSQSDLYRVKSLKNFSLAG